MCISIDFISDCTYSDKNGKHSSSHATNNNNTNTVNKNSISNNNHQNAMRQFSISEDGPTITEDDLDNLINQSINEWQQRQKSINTDDKTTIDVDVTPLPTSIIS